MTLQAWKEALSNKAGDPDFTSILAMLKWSLIKWEMLDAETLAQYGVIRYRGTCRDVDGNEDGEGYDIGLHCPLCRVFACDSCPLSKLRDGISCSDPLLEEHCSPWRSFWEYGKTEPMIELLKKAIEERERKKVNKL